MPLYEFECEKCRATFETIDHVDTCPQELPCPDCGGKARKIISSRGAVHGDTPNWLDDSVQGALLDIDSRQFRAIETRSKLKKHMKAHGICEAPRSGARWI
jgi:putative FmdB family regulatory protein